MKIQDTAVVVGGGVVGGGGLTLQAVHDGMSFALLAGNLVLVALIIVYTGYRFWRTIAVARKPPEPPGD